MERLLTLSDVYNPMDNVKMGMQMQQLQHQQREFGLNEQTLALKQRELDLKIQKEQSEAAAPSILQKRLKGITDNLGSADEGARTQAENDLDAFALETGKPELMKIADQRKARRSFISTHFKDNPDAGRAIFDDPHAMKEWSEKNIGFEQYNVGLRESEAKIDKTRNAIKATDEHIEFVKAGTAKLQAETQSMNTWAALNQTEKLNVMRAQVKALDGKGEDAASKVALAGQLATMEQDNLKAAGLDPASREQRAVAAGQELDNLKMMNGQYETASIQDISTMGIARYDQDRALLSSRLDAQEKHLAYLKDPSIENRAAMQSAAAVLQAQQDVLVSTRKQHLATLEEERSAHLKMQDKKLQSSINKDKHAMGMESSLAEAQVAFHGLPEEKQTGAEAAKIAQQVGKRTGFTPKVSDILPKGSLVTVNNNAASPGERKDIAEGRASIGLLDQTMKLFKPEYVGMLDSRVGGLRSTTGKISSGEAEFRAASDRFLVEARHAIYGSAFTETEKNTMLEALPTIGMSDQQYKSSVKITRDNLKRIEQERIKAIEEFGPGKKTKSSAAKPHVPFEGASNEAVEFMKKHGIVQ